MQHSKYNRTLQFKANKASHKHIYVYVWPCSEVNDAVSIVMKQKEEDNTRYSPTPGDIK